MACEYFSAAVASRRAVVEGALDSFGCFIILENILLPFAEENQTEKSRFQQDNSSARTSNNTKMFLSDINVSYLDCPSRSPNLNSIDNL